VVTDPAVLTTLRQVTPSFGATGAAAVIVLCTDTAVALRDMGTLGRDTLSLVDAGAAAANVALVAAALGLGVSFIRSSNDAALRTVLDMPANVRADLLIAIGWPVPAPLPAAHRAAPPLYWNSFAAGPGRDDR
jgi:nitroreductase